MTVTSIRFALATAGVVATIGGVAAASAAQSPHPGNTTSPGGYAVDQCGNGKWKNFTNPTFKNQGQCVSFFVHSQH